MQRQKQLSLWFGRCTHGIVGTLQILVSAIMVVARCHKRRLRFLEGFRCLVCLDFGFVEMLFGDLVLLLGCPGLAFGIGHLVAREPGPLLSYFKRKRRV
jgi:hypothetical protein